MRRPSLLLLLAMFALKPASAQNRETFRFIQITDTHLTATANVEPLRKFVADIGAMNPKPAFVVDTGDVTEAGRPEEYARFSEGTAGLDVPLYCAPGNHDVRWSPLGKEGFASTFKRLYQSFDRGGCHFVILDSTVLLEHWGHFDAPELKWLEGDLKKVKSTTPVMLFFHHWIGREPQMVDNEEALLRILQPYNVAAMFVGHGHADMQWKVNGIDCFMARGLYQGSYNMVDVGPSEIRVMRMRKEDNGPKILAVIPRDRTPKHVEFLWDDPNIPLLARRRPLAELRVGKGGAHDDLVTAQYSLDSGEPKNMLRDTRDKQSVSFIAQFSTKDLVPGTHRLRLQLTDPGGDVYHRDELFQYEQLEGLPKRKWDDSYKADDAIQSSPTLAGDTLYVSSLDGKLYAIDPKNGHRRWAASTKGPLLSSPRVENGTIYVGSMDHNLYAFDAHSGRPMWRFDAGSPIFSSAAILDGTVCFGTNRKIYGLDATNGQKRWEQDADGFFQSRAAAADGAFYLGGWDNTLYALDAATGAPKWKARMGRANGAKGAIAFYYSPAISSPVIADGRVLVCTDDGVLHAVNAKTGQDDWTARAPEGGDRFGYSSPLHSGGRVYVGGLGPHGDCYALDAKDGSQVWRCSTGAENYDSSPSLAGNLLVIGSVKSLLSWIDAATGKVRYQYQLDSGWCFSTPATTPETTYIGSMSGMIYAIDLPK